MIARLASLMIASAAFGAAGLAQSQDAPVATRVAAAANSVCIDLLSGRVRQPDLAGEPAFWARYKLEPGLPDAAMAALSPNGVGLLSQALLASSTGGDGDLAVAIGGRAGPSCRLIIYGAKADRGVAATVMAAVTDTGIGGGWRELPSPRQAPGVSRRSAIRRLDGRAFLLNATAPVTSGPVAAVITVAQIPANVTIPEGY